MRALLVHNPTAGSNRPTGRALLAILDDAGFSTTYRSSKQNDFKAALAQPADIVIVAGFQGVSTNLDVTTLGRGGSDTTAVALAAALGADVCEIYTDVDGVYTADPRLVPDARKLLEISHEEMLELSAAGAKVLMVRSVEYARNHRVTIHVRSSYPSPAQAMAVLNTTHHHGEWIEVADGRLHRPGGHEAGMLAHLT